MTQSNPPFQYVGIAQVKNIALLIINDLGNHFQGNSIFKRIPLRRKIKVDFF